MEIVVLKCLLWLMGLLLAAPASGTVVLDLQVVGDAGNGNDPTTGNKYGAVSYPYRIGKFEVTNAQYVEFLNAKARLSDPYHLYDTKMSTDGQGGIARTLRNGVYTYRVATIDPDIVGAGGSVANRPVVFVTRHSAMRFSNWLQNGQGDSDTETGAYTLLGGTVTPSNATTLTRNPGAQYFIPTHNEWYKAGLLPTRISGRRCGQLLVLSHPHQRAAQQRFAAG
jgi:formylglycine-generating enzyme